MKRLAFYVFFEKNGIICNHNLFYLHGLKSVAQDIILITKLGETIFTGEIPASILR